MSKKFCFWRPLEKQNGRRAEALLKSESQHLYHTYWSVGKQLSWKKYLLVICKILGLFVNTLTADHKFSLLNGDKWMQPIQMHLSKTQKAFSQFSAAFLKWSSNFEHLQTKDDPHSWCIFEITDSQNCC